MAISLYDATVRSYLQGLSAMGGFLAKGLAHCQSAGIGPDTLVETRLYEDMLPFRFQVQAAAHHSWGALQAMIKGEFAPPATDSGDRICRVAGPRGRSQGRA